MASYTPFDVDTPTVFESDYTHEGEFTGYVTAHDESSRPIDELGTHESNRWTHQGFFNNPLSLKPDSDRWTAYNLHLTDSLFVVDYSDNNDQAYVDISSIEPDDDDGADFSLTIAVPLGPLSVGTSAVEMDNCVTDDDDYIRTEWNMQHGLGERLPTSQEESIGVRYDVEAAGTPGNYRIDNLQQHGWEVIETTRTGSLSVYSTTTPYYHGQWIEVV